MFGWEFPPHIAGGLGTACYGMTRGLARNDVEVIFVMPHASGDEDQRFVKVVNASDVEALYGDVASGADDIVKKMTFIHIDSNMVPYISPEEYATYHEEFMKTGRKVWETGRRLETALHLLGQVRRQPHGGGGPLRRGRRPGGQGLEGSST